MPTRSASATLDLGWLRDGPSSVVQWSNSILLKWQMVAPNPAIDHSNSTSPLGPPPGQKSGILSRILRKKFNDKNGFMELRRKQVLSGVGTGNDIQL